MAAHLSGRDLPVSLRHGVRSEVISEIEVQVLLAIEEGVGCESIVLALWVNKAVVVFVTDRELRDFVTLQCENGLIKSVKTPQ